MSYPVDPLLIGQGTKDNVTPVNEDNPLHVQLATNPDINIGEVEVNNAANNAVFIRPGTGTNLNTSNVTVSTVTPPTAIKHGQNAAGLAQAQLASNALTQGVTIKARRANTGIVYVGINGVTTANGYPLSAGDSVFIACDNTDRIYVISDTAAQSVGFIGS